MRVSIAVAAVCLSLVAICVADNAHAAMRKPINIPAQPLGSALEALARTRDVQVIYRSDLVRSIASAGAVGELTPEEALKRLLEGTGLTYRYLNDTTVTITPAGSASPFGKMTGLPAAAASTSTGESEAQKNDGFWDRFLVAQQGSEQTPNASPVENSPRAAKEPVRLEEVLVTAQKREQRLQDVPMSLAVISNQDIERRGLIGMEDYLRSIPGVNQIDVGPQSNAIVIRGITTSPQNENFYSGTTVASYFGETPITGAAGPNAGGIDVRPVDIERIEVLRGPQGTAFGDASLGGTLRIIPKAPDLHQFGLKLGGDYSNTAGFGSNNSMLQAVVNVPIVTDTLAIRVVGYRFDDSGFYRNIAGHDPATQTIFDTYGLGNLVRGYVQDDVGRMLTTGGRVAALWAPTENARLTLTFLTQTIEQDGDPAATLDAFDQARAPIAAQARVRGETGEAADTTMHLSNLVFDYNLGWSTLTATGSWIDGGSVYAHDLSSSFMLPSSTTAPSDFRSLTGETRLVSRLPGPFEFLAGLYYEDIKDGSSPTLDWPGSPSTSFFGTNPMYIQDITRKLVERAVFGEASYDLTPTLTATVGGRYFKYQKHEQDLTEGGLIGVPLGTGVPVNLATDQGHSNYKANLSYKPRKDTLVYLLWSQGFRLGRPQDTTLISALCDTDHNGLIDGTTVSVESIGRVNPDFLDNYEVGGKFTALDSRLVIDSSIYHIKWKGLPITTGAGACPLTFAANVGEAKSDGADFQASVVLTRDLRVDFGVGYSNAELTKAAPSLGANEGARLPGSPRVNGNLAAQYDFTVSGHKAFVRADSFYAGRFYGDLLESPSLAAGDYVKVDARAGVAIRNLTVELFGRNLTNQDAFTWRGGFPLAPASAYGYRLRPRTFGIQLGYGFE